MAATEINISDFASKTQDTLSNTDNVLMCGDGSVANKIDVFSLKQALNSYNAFFGANKLKLYSGMFPLDSDFKKETFTTDSKKCATKIMATNDVQITFDDTLYNVYAYYADITFNYTATRVINNGDFISTALPYIRIYCERKDNADITPGDVNVYIGQTKEAIRNDYFNACFKELSINDASYVDGDKYYVAILYKSNATGIQINITKNGTDVTPYPSTDKTVCKYLLGVSYYNNITPVITIPEHNSSGITAKALMVWNNVQTSNLFYSKALGAYELPLSCINHDNKNLAYLSEKINSSVTDDDALKIANKRVNNEHIYAIKELKIYDPNKSESDKYYLSVLLNTSSLLQIGIAKNNPYGSAVCSQYISGNSAILNRGSEIVELIDSNDSGIYGKAVIDWNDIPKLNIFSNAAGVNNVPYEMPDSWITATESDLTSFPSIITPHCHEITNDNKNTQYQTPTNYAVTKYITDTTVKKETGKGLSTNDYTNEDKTKLDSLSLNLSFTDRDGVNNVLDELYITGLQEGYYFSYFIWNGSVITSIIRDSSDNIVWFANDLPATAGSVFSYSQGGVTVYAIFNNNTYLLSPQDTNILGKALNLASNPRISEYLFTPVEKYHPLCVSRFDLGELLPNGLYNASLIGITRRCDNVNDSVFCFGNKTAAAVSNKFFDLHSVGTHARGERFVSEMGSYVDLSTKNWLPTSDSLLLPLIVGAVNNADGDNLTDKWFTGGAHAFGNTTTGSPTMRELSNTVMVDGKSLSIGQQNVRGRVCTIDVVNNIQGYNTCKENGGGREIIQQRAHIEITNTYIESTIEFVALEEVVVYGDLYASGINVQEMTGYRFLGSQSKRGQYVFNNNANIPSNDDTKINAIRILCDGTYIFDTELDLSFGLGNHLISGEPNSFVTVAGKAYFRVMPSSMQIHLDTNESIIYRTRLYFRKAN